MTVSAPEQVTTAASSGIGCLLQAEASWDNYEPRQALLHFHPAGNIKCDGTVSSCILQDVFSYDASTFTAVHLSQGNQQVAQE